MSDVLQVRSDSLAVEPAQPRPLGAFLTQQVLMDVKVVEKKRVAYSMDHQRNVVLAVWHFQQLLDALKNN